MSTIFNPLASLSEDLLESTSKRLVNDTPGRCPKCENLMGIAKIDAEDVYYCDSCRVCQPIPE
jgi:hypothetical protein